MEHRGTLTGQMALNIAAYRDGLGRADAANWRAHGHPQFKSGTQLDRVHKAMMGGKWATLARIANEAGIPTSTVGSRIRDLRKPKGHEHIIHVEPYKPKSKLHVYRMGEKNG